MPEWALGYRFDIVLGGRERDAARGRTMTLAALTPVADGRAVLRDRPAAAARRPTLVARRRPARDPDPRHACSTARASRCPTRWSRSGRPTPTAATSTRTTPRDVPARGFRGFGRSDGDDGRFAFVTVKPGRCPARTAAAGAAPRRARVRARAAQAASSPGSTSPTRPRRTPPTRCSSRLGRASARRCVAAAEDDGLRFDIRLQGDGETVFFAAVTRSTPLFVPGRARATAVSDARLARRRCSTSRRRSRGARRAAGRDPGRRRRRRSPRRAAPSCFDVDDARRAGRARPATRPSRSCGRCARRVGGDAAGYVHRGATSQDIIDTAAMLVARARARPRSSAELDGAARPPAPRWPRRTATTPMAGAHAAAAGACRPRSGSRPRAGSSALARRAARPRRGPRRAARRRSSAARRARSRRSATRARRSLRPLRGRARARRAGAPVAHDRTPVAELGAALGDAAGALAKIGARRRAARADRGRRGARGAPAAARRRCRTSATRSPRRCARACAARVRGHAAVLSARWRRSTSARPAPGTPSGRRSPERWRSTGGAAAALARGARGLEVDAERMRANLEATGGLVVAERVSFLLAERYGRAEGHAIARDAAAAGGCARGVVRGELRADDRVDLPAERARERASTRRRISARPRRSSTARSTLYRAETS